MFQNPYLTGYNMNTYAGYGQNTQNTQTYAQRCEQRYHSYQGRQRKPDKRVWQC